MAVSRSNFGSPTIETAGDRAAIFSSCAQTRSEHSDGVIRRELVSGECARRLEQNAAAADSTPKLIEKLQQDLKKLE
jgi:hypothetical protein